MLCRVGGITAARVIECPLLEMFEERGTEGLDLTRLNFHLAGGSSWELQPGRDSGWGDTSLLTACFLSISLSCKPDVYRPLPGTAHPAASPV
jgi:hypothetical protein